MSEIKDDAGFLVLLPRCSIQANWFGATLIVAQESKADITVGEKPYLVDDTALIALTRYLCTVRKTSHSHKKATLACSLCRNLHNFGNAFAISILASIGGVSIGVLVLKEL
jgi:hypothetical protein